MLFDLAYAPTATTGPTHASLFTSLYPPTHGVIKNGLILEDSFLTLAEVLSGAGYQTAGVVSSFVLKGRFGYAQGFDSYADDFRVETSTINTNAWEDHVVQGGFDRRAEETTRLAQEWLTEKRNARQPFLLFVHYFDPHSPYVPPPEYLASLGEDPSSLTGLERVILDYDAEITYTDAQLGALLGTLAALGLEDSTIVVVTSDHGEGLMQHGHLEHGVQIYEEAVRVPLILRWPGKIRPGSKVASPFPLVDLSPTLLELATPELTLNEAQGFSRAAAILGLAPWDPVREVLLFRRYYQPQPGRPEAPRGIQLGIRSGRWKYIHGLQDGTSELFDLETDPGETRNLAAERPERRHNLSNRLAHWMRSVQPQELSDPEAITPEDRRRLEALGYID